MAGVRRRALMPTQANSSQGDWIPWTCLCLLTSITLISLASTYNESTSKGPPANTFSRSIGMGNCCGSESGNFSGEGRTLGAAPANAPPQRDGARASAPPKISGPKGGRTLGKNPQAPDESSSPKQAAARAAEVRSTSSTSPLKARKGRAPSGRMVSTAWM